MQHWQAEKWPLLSVDKPATHKAADLAPPCVDKALFRYRVACSGGSARSSRNEQIFVMSSCGRDAVGVQRVPVPG